MLEYEVVDVFAPRAYAGNPLAVVFGADDLTTEQCQALAFEFHLSETSFLCAPTEPGADYRVRIFTPYAELPFAGHPSVGAAHTLVRTGRLPAGTVRQECGVGEGVSVLSWDAATSTAYARVFAGDLHWDEDPATGSAALGTGVWLVATGLLDADGTSSYVVRQGEKMGRPSVLSCTVTATGGTAQSATVQGAVVPIASGRIRVP